MRISRLQAIAFLIMSWALGAGVFLAAGPVQARPVHKRALADYFGPFLAKKLNDCRTCHVPDDPGKAGQALEATPTQKAHNAFGARLKAVKKELHKAGKNTDLVARLEAILEEDSDGDGVSNLIELLTGHFPGDANDKPTAEEIAKSKKILVEFRKFQSQYPWRPYEVVKRPAVPKVKNADWVRNSIDSFIAAEHQEHGLNPRPEATKAVLLRRVYLDLIGLPPTPDELHEFLSATSADSYEKVVDNLLASPRYGERWGRHWMDIWRYSDWAGWGAEVRDSQPHVWRWRDWIVESLNKDKGYDRMIVEMLAGDEVAPEDNDVVRATGYLVRNYKRYSREKWMQDTVEHTFQGFLATTIGCARCHDHMFDPLLQKEYYRLRAVFEPYNVRIDRLPGQPDTKLDGLARAFDADPTVKTVLFIRGDEKNPDKSPLEPGVPEVLGGHFSKAERISLPLFAYRPDKREFIDKEALVTAKEAVGKAIGAIELQRRYAAQALAQGIFGGPRTALPGLAISFKLRDPVDLAAVDVTLAEARLTALQAVIGAERFEEGAKKETEEAMAAAIGATAAQRSLAFFEAKRNLLFAQQTLQTLPVNARAEQAKRVAEATALLAKAESDLHLPSTIGYSKRSAPVYPSVSTGRRLAFSRWLADRDNPLTARVAMNHIWLRHFGQGIVPSVFDFGRNGRQPSHPALLDWLAAEFMEQRWSMKAMHRLIVTSSTYRMASTPDSSELAIDRDNKYLWRMNSRPIEAEVVRDCIFQVAGKLDLKMGGPDIDHTLGLSVPRRSLYFQHAAEKQMEFLKIFDGPDVFECYRRKTSIMPQQALALANSEVTLKHARILARTLAAAKTGSDPATFTTSAFERVLSRLPTDAELAECVSFLKQQLNQHGTETGQPAVTPDPDGKLPSPDPAVRARENLVHVLLNHHDFVTIR